MAKGQIILKENGVFVGKLMTYAIALNFKLTVRQGLKTDKSPTHTIEGYSPAGHYFEAGVAWEKPISKGEKAGQTFFVLCFDDPVFGEKPVYYNAWPGEEGFYIEPERGQKPEPKQDEVKDEIPFHDSEAA